MKSPSSALLGQAAVAALNQSATTGVNLADTGACPYGGYDLAMYGRPPVAAQAVGGNGKYDPAIHRRRSIRLQGYDYSQAGAYFVTVCTQNRECLFGEIVDGEMWLNDAGNIARQCWDDIPIHFPHVDLDEFAVMPNHIHGIVVITGNVGAKNFSPLPQTTRPCGTSKTIGSIVRGFKIGVTKWMRNKTSIYDVWQRNYWEHIIRNELELNRIREYIHNNPARWELDSLNAGKGGPRTAPTEIREPITEYNVEAWMA